MNRYRAYRRAQGADPSTDTAHDLVATFDGLQGRPEAWADKIGNDNKTSTHAGAPLKAFAILSEAQAMIGEGVVTTQELRDAAHDPDRIAEIKSVWLNVPGQKPGTTWHYVQMLAGIPGVKPDRMIMRFVADALGLERRRMSSEFAAEAVTMAADVINMSATDLDYGIWNWQRSQRGRRIRLSR